LPCTVQFCPGGVTYATNNHTNTMAATGIRLNQATNAQRAELVRAAKQSEDVLQLYSLWYHSQEQQQTLTTTAVAKATNVPHFSPVSECRIHHRTITRSVALEKMHGDSFPQTPFNKACHTSITRCNSGSQKLYPTWRSFEFAAFMAPSRTIAPASEPVPFPPSSIPTGVEFAPRPAAQQWSVRYDQWRSSVAIVCVSA
jgi:hypothetical protein